ncbi:MAG: GatB/YqeY domain-containing protein, partial [Bacteroidales bacterium]|nr:GatB/YqeY domain-containing protein [Bacteroidales bacterium]
YLPEQMSEEEIRTTLQNIVSETGASSMKDMGKVMGAAQKAFAGRADNKLVSAIVKELLG